MHDIVERRLAASPLLAWESNRPSRTGRRWFRDAIKGALKGPPHRSAAPRPRPLLGGGLRRQVLDQGEPVVAAAVLIAHFAHELADEHQSAAADGKSARRDFRSLGRVVKRIEPAPIVDDFDLHSLGRDIERNRDLSRVAGLRGIFRALTR